MSVVPKVPIEQWAALIDAAEDFQDLAPWEWMTGNEIFAVMNNERPQAGYCCVMGNLGEVFGLVVYMGSEGLALIEEMFADEAPPNPMDILLKTNCLKLEFVGAQDLEKEDKAVFKKLGLKYKGAHAWPLFRSHRPGDAPWCLEDWEVRFLTTCLQQTMEMASRLKKNPDLLVPSDDSQFFFRLPEPNSNPVEWSDKWLVPEPAQKKELPKLILDEIQFAAEKAKVKHIDLVWEMDLLVLPMPIDDRDRPYFMRTFMVADQKSRYMLAAEPMDPFEYPSLLLSRIVKIIAITRIMPKTIHFCSADLRSLLTEPLQKMGIEARFVNELPVINEAFAGMMDFLGKPDR